MKAFIVQPPYSRDYAKSDEFFKWELDMFDECDESMDIVVFPESCDVPAYAPDEAHNIKSIDKYQTKIIEKAIETAKRCNAIVVINAHMKEATGYRNTTLVYDRNGNEVFRYYKQTDDANYSFINYTNKVGTSLFNFEDGGYNICILNSPTPSTVNEILS